MGETAPSPHRAIILGKPSKNNGRRVFKPTFMAPRCVKAAGKGKTEQSLARKTHSQDDCSGNSIYWFNIIQRKASQKIFSE